MSYYEYDNTCDINCGDTFKILPVELKKRNCRNVFLFNNAGSDKTVSQKIKTALKENDIEIKAVYTETKQVALTDTVNKLINLYHANGCDSILVYGTPNVIYLAKAVKLLAVSNRSDIKSLEGMNNITEKQKVPMIVISNDYGSGTEVTRAVVIHDDERNYYTYINRCCLPDVCILDPTIMSNASYADIYSGIIDNLAHSIESYTSRIANEITQSFSLSAIAKLKNNFEKRLLGEKDEKTILEMKECSILAATAFSNAFGGLAHAIAHALSQHTGLSHAKAISLVLPSVLEFNAKFNSEEYSELLYYLAGKEIYLACEKSKRSDAFVKYVRDIVAQYSKGANFPSKLTEIGLDEHSLEKIAESALCDSSFMVNKGTINKGNILDILKRLL